MLSSLQLYGTFYNPPPPWKKRKKNSLNCVCFVDRPFSRPVISTDSLDGGMFSTAVTQSSPALFTFLYSTRNDWMGKPRLPRGIQVTYAEVSVAVETVGLSGASGAAEEEEEEEWCQPNTDITHSCRHLNLSESHRIHHLLLAHPSETEMQKRVRSVSQKCKHTVRGGHCYPVDILIIAQVLLVLVNQRVICSSRDGEGGLRERLGEGTAGVLGGSIAPLGPFRPGDRKKQKHI